MRQTDIPAVQAGEPLGQSLLNMLGRNANVGRFMTGDGVLTSQIGGTIGFSLNQKLGNGDRGVLVEVDPTTDIGGGFYRGKLFLQPVVPFQSGIDSTGNSSAMSPVPMPYAVTCYVVNLREVSPDYWTSDADIPSRIGTNLITVKTLALGRYIGPMSDTGLASPQPQAPLIAVSIGESSSGGGVFTVLVKQNGVDADSWPKYDVYALADVGLTTKLNLSGALVPVDDNGNARWPQRASGAVPIAAADGTKGYAYYDLTGAIQLAEVPEKLCTNTGTGSTVTIDGGGP